MNTDDGLHLSEAAANVVENLATRVAQRHGGRLTPNHIVPYLPMSLALIKRCLDQMADGASVVAEEQDGFVGYLFTAYKDAPVEDGVLDVTACVSCDKDLEGAGAELLCSECSALLRKELNRLAERTAWPAQAVYEHEILYRAAKHKGPVPPAAIAGESRYTLRSTRRKLDRLSLDRYARQELDQAAGLTKYCFPEISYPRELYRKNMAVIRSYPASLMEEVQIKVVRIFATLGVMLLGMLALAICTGIPFPFLMLLFLVAGPAVAFWIWRHREKPQDD